MKQIIIDIPETETEKFNVNFPEGLNSKIALDSLLLSLWGLVYDLSPERFDFNYHWALERFNYIFEDVKEAAKEN